METITIEVKERKSERFWMRMSPTLRGKLKALAKSNGLKDSELARQILEQGVAQLEQQRRN